MAEWFGGVSTAAEVEAEYDPLIDDPSTVRPPLVLVDGAPAGHIRSDVAMAAGDGWWADERDPGVRGIDPFLAEVSQLNSRLWTAMVRAFVAWRIPVRQMGRRTAVARRGGARWWRAVVTRRGDARW